MDDSLEKFMTQPSCQPCTLEQSGVHLLEKSDQVLFDSVNSKSQRSQTLLTHFYQLSNSDKKLESKEIKIETASVERLSDMCKPSIDLFASTSNKNNLRLCLTTSGLKEVDFKIVNSFCQKFSVILLDKVTQNTTHLIVKVDEKNRTCRTFKYLQAIVNCVSIVSVKWLQDCLQRNEILNEVSFY